MANEQRILIAVDESPASARAVRFVSRMVPAGGDYMIFLLHILPPTPPGLLEFGGITSGTNSELKAEKEHESVKERWLTEAKKATQPIFEKMKKILIENGVSEECIDTIFYASRPENHLVPAVLEIAHEKECGTVIVGREWFPWYQEIFHHHLGDELKKKEAHGFAVWTVE